MTLKILALVVTLANGAALAQTCSPEQGFRLGLAGEQRPDECNQRAYRIDFELGRNIQRLRNEQVELQENLSTQTKETIRREINGHLQRLERELHELEGLATIRGLLPQQP